MTHRAPFLMAVTAVGVVVGILLNWPELIAVCVALCVILAFPALSSRPRAATWADVAAPVRVARGEPAAVIIDVHVAQGSTRWVSAVAEDGRDRVFLPKGSTCALTWNIDTSRRGQFFVGPTRLEVADPFGLSCRVLAERPRTPILVVPNVHAVNTGILPSQSDIGEDGTRIGSDTFHSLRDYTIGDPQKLVHWRSSARAGKLMVRRMVDSTLPSLLIVLDVDMGAYDRHGAEFADFSPEAFEAAVDLAASWTWHSCGPAQRVMVTTTCLTASDSPPAVEVSARNRDSALDWFAMIDAQPRHACGPGRVNTLVRRGVSRVLLITGEHGDLSMTMGWQRGTSVTVLTAGP